MEQKSESERVFRVHVHAITCGDVEVRAKDAKEARALAADMEMDVSWSEAFDDFKIVSAHRQFRDEAGGIVREDDDTYFEDQHQ